MTRISMGKIFCVITILCTASVIPAVAQAWVQPVDGYYVKFSHGRVSTDSRFDLEGETIPFDSSVENGRFKDGSFYVYGEYGLSKTFSGVLLIPIKSLNVQSDDGESTTTGIGRLYLGTRIDVSGALPGSSPVAAVQLGARLPTGNARNLAPSVDTGQIDLEASLAVGRGWKSVYSQAEIGYRLRPSWYGLSRTIDCDNTTRSNCGIDNKGDFANEWFYKLELGGTLQNRVLAQIILTSNNSITVGDAILDPNNPLSESSRLTSIGFGATLYASDGLGLSIQHISTLDGVNTLDASTWFFGVEVRR